MSELVEYLESQGLDNGAWAFGKMLNILLRPQCEDRLNEQISYIARNLIEDGNFSSEYICELKTWRDWLEIEEGIARYEGYGLFSFADDTLPFKDCLCCLLTPQQVYWAFSYTLKWLVKYRPQAKPRVSEVMLKYALPRWR